MKIFSVIKKIVILTLGPVAIAAVSAWLYLQGGRHITTDNAYIKTDITSVSSEISGKIVEAYPMDNEPVTTGQVLFRLAREPHLIAVASAEAALDNIRREIDSQKVEYETLQIEIERAQIDLEFQEMELERASQLLERGTISSEQYDQALIAWRRSENTLKKQQQEARVASARLIDPEMPTEEHPAYRQALTKLDNARLNLSYTEIKSPIDGIAVNVSALPGENIIMGTALLNIIDDSQLWIEANYKETDLTYVKKDQPVEIRIDTYPDAVWQGIVSNITPATGAEFSLLPAQNSSGNWVKVVQRITVRIDFTELQNEPKLSTGMSAEVSIDTGHQRTLPWID